MKSEQIKEIISNHPYLMKITPSTFSKVFRYITGEDLDYTKTYGEQGLYDLDLVELVMHLEKEFNINIHDDLIRNRNVGFTSEPHITYTPCYI